VPNVIVVRAAVPARSLAELIALAKAEPGRLNDASAGNGTFPHLAMALLLQQAGISMTHVPYNGAAPAMTAILACQPAGAVTGSGPGLLHPRSIRAAAVPGGRRCLHARSPAASVVDDRGYILIPAPARRCTRDADSA
jgi:tripartite-type tricarboxylate transporter receptor subunit TctC